MRQPNKFTVLQQSLLSHSGLGPARVMVDTLGRVSCVSIYQDSICKEHKSITKKKKHTVFEKKNRKRSRKREGCNKDYVLVLEADNSQGSCKFSLHNKLTIYLSYMYFGLSVKQPAPK